MNKQNIVALWMSLAALAGLVAPAVAHAEGEIYLCVDANGQKELTDTNRKGKCKALDLPAAIPAPPKRSGPAASSARGPAAAGPAASPGDFPKVDSAEQKARDNDRRQILLDELRSEEAKLAALKKDYNNGEPERNGNERNYAKYQERVALMKDNVSRAEKNVEALKREIANIR
ncbi:putative uncharacterized protein [Janthinobacterium agaricidamnosum NBRC 102515 = DSM 9628]|uniref:DUF4124 domain-containing protein n=2 Tax=Janthinobacterium agaricidamnosum TaxID=55508 RepID=W0V809_9BURK|nr:putative uncharacterized protein [Janthinobacterium agaricidamnosum NBRC 102515 = DSM 9628]